MLSIRIGVLSRAHDASGDGITRGSVGDYDSVLIAFPQVRRL